VLSSNICDHLLDKKKVNMPANTKVNVNISDKHQPAYMQMNRCFYLISWDKEFSTISSQFWVHFLINNVNKQHGSRSASN